MRAASVLVLALALLPGCGSPTTETDAGADAGLGVDAAARVCFTDPDCDDGIYCNGVETCSSGHCARAPLACDDGIACTRDVCNENTHACVSRAADEDGDGFGDASCTDTLGVALGTDCDDTDPTVFPGNPEVCDAIDQDCDPTTLGGGDTDHDGAVPIACCNPTPTGMTCGRDCDDANPSISQLATEICDDVDDDCDGMVDENTRMMSWPDVDLDGFGDASATAEDVCIVPSSRANQGGDCDDHDDMVRPTASERCNAIDDDCDGTVDEETDAVCSALPGTTGECIAGRCVTTRCDATHFDCNGDDADGCEAAICSGSTTCGSCTRQCAAPLTTCGGGYCPGVNASFAMLGFLHDVTGAPVAGATITSIDTCPIITATTAADGSYTLGPMTSVPSIVRIEAPGYPTHVQPHGSTDAFGPILTQALLDAWTADPDRAASPSADRAIVVFEYGPTLGDVIHDGILGSGNGATGSDLLPASSGPRQVFFQAVPGRMNVAGTYSDGSGCTTNCGPQQRLYLEAGHVTYVGTFSCATTCS